MPLWTRIKAILLWILSTGVLALANHFNGNVLTDWMVEGLSVLLSLPVSAINAGIVKVALLGGAAAVAIYLGYRVAKRSTS
jgi:hypothetical protein